MKKISTLTLFLMLSIALFSQNINKGLLPVQIGEATFDGPKKLVFVGETAEGLRVLALMTKQGAYRKKMKSLYSGGAEEVTITALGEFFLNEKLEVTKSTYTVVKPDGDQAMLGDFEVLNKPSKIGKTVVIAKKSECKSLWDLADQYPELKDGYGEAEEASEFYGPAVYYKNELSYKMLSGALKKIVLNKKTKNKKPAAAKEATTLKGAFKDMFKSEEKVAPYAEETKEKVVEDTYNGRGKKDYWVSLSPYFSDPVDGTMIGHHGHFYAKDAPRKRNTNFEQELVAFDVNGEVAGRIELNFEQPMELERSVAFRERGAYWNAHDLQAVGYLFKELTGPFTKKINPNPDPLVRHFYRINDSGEQDYTFTFNMESNDQSIKQIVQTPQSDNFSMLTWSQKAKVFAWYQMGAEGVISNKKIDSKNADYESLKEATLAPGGVTWKELASAVGEDGNRTTQMLVSYEQTNTETKVKTKRYRGYLKLMTDEKGALQKIDYLKRSTAANFAEKPSWEVLKTEGDISTILYFDPLKAEPGGKADLQKVRILSQNNKTLERVDLLKEENQFSLDPEASEYIYNAEKGLIYFMVGEEIVAVRI